MKIYEKAVNSSTAPLQTNVLWIDSSASPAVMKIFNNGEWKQVGGSGGGMSGEGTPGNFPVIGEDGKELIGGLISQTQLQNIITLIGNWDTETVAMVRNASTLSYFLNVLIGADSIPTFSASTYYAIGDIALYNSKLYRFTAAHHGDWSDSDVVLTNFYSEYVRYYSGAVNEENVSVQLNFDTATAPSFTDKYVSTTVNGVTTDHEISSTGLCQFTMPKGTLYTISFPSFTDYYGIASRSFTAYIAQRSVEANYASKSAETDQETVYLEATYTTGSGYPSGTVTVNDTTASTTSTYTLDAEGKCSFIIPFEHTYTITLPSISGYITTSQKTFTASLPIRNVQSKYAPLVSGMFIMDANLNQYTYQQWVDAGKSGTEAKYFYFSDSALVAGGGAFFFNIDDIRTTTTIPSKKWLSSNVLVTTLSTFANRAAAITDFGVVPYDPEVAGSGPISNINAIKSFIDDQATQGMTYTSQIYDYAITKNLTIGGSEYKAYIGTAAQWRYLSNESDGNYGTLNQICSNLHQTDSTIPADLGWLTKAFWTSTQYSSTYSWLLNFGSLGNNGSSKNYSYSCLCFYAL